MLKNRFNHDCLVAGKVAKYPGSGVPVLMEGRGNKRFCRFLFHPKISLIIFHGNKQRSGTLDRLRAYYLHRSLGAGCVFFSWILHKLYIKPCSSNSFRCLTFKWCRLRFSVVSFFHFRLFLVFFWTVLHRHPAPTYLQAHLSPRKQAPPPAHAAVSRHGIIYGLHAGCTGVREPWQGENA